MCRMLTSLASRHERLAATYRSLLPVARTRRARRMLETLAAREIRLACDTRACAGSLRAVVSMPGRVSVARPYHAVTHRAMDAAAVTALAVRLERPIVSALGRVRALGRDHEALARIAHGVTEVHIRDLLDTGARAFETPGRSFGKGPASPTRH